MTDLPEETADEAERLTRLARAAVDESERDAYRERRAELLAEHGYTARVRTEDETAARGGADREDDGDVLVCHPAEWLDGDEVRLERIADTDRAVERRLSGRDAADDWGAVAAHNERVAELIGDAYSDVHAANARAFADYMSNHHARRVESATETEREEFLAEYFVRNAWPTDEQRAAVETSLALVSDVAGAIDDGSE